MYTFTTKIDDELLETLANKYVELKTKNYKFVNFLEYIVGMQKIIKNSSISHVWSQR